MIPVSATRTLVNGRVVHHGNLTTAQLLTRMRAATEAERRELEAAVLARAKSPGRR